MFVAVVGKGHRYWSVFCNIGTRRRLLTDEHVGWQSTRVASNIGSENAGQIGHSEQAVFIVHIGRFGRDGVAYQRCIGVTCHGIGIGPVTITVIAGGVAVSITH